MTKTLTEQWREGTLPEDCYYILTKNGHIRKERTCFYSHTDEQCFSFISNKDIEEIIGPVPSYERIKDLDRLEQFCELILAGEKQEWENIVKRGDRKEMARWLNERKNKTVDRLEKKLAIAKKALKEIDVRSQRDWNEYDCMGCARKALYDIEMKV